MNHAKSILGLIVLAGSGYALWLATRPSQGGASVSIGDLIQVDDEKPATNPAYSAFATALPRPDTGIGMWVTPKAGLMYEPLFQAATAKYGLPAGLLSRVAYQESRYNPKAYNAGSKAAGMMQFIPSTAKEFGIDPYNPSQAIDAAGRYMKQLYARFGNWTEALAAYNWGQGNVAKKGLSNAPTETKNYFAQILGDLGFA